MTDNIVSEMAPLKRAYLDALEARGRDAADKAIQKHTNGARGQNAWRHVKDADVATAINDLEQLTLSGDGDVAKVESRFASIAKRAFGKETRVKPAKTLDATSIYQKWNGSK